MAPTSKAPTLTCPVCGTENPSTRLFCRKCAADLHAPAPDPNAPVVPEPEPVPIKPIAIGGGVALVLVALVIGLIVILTGSPGSSPSPGPASAAPTNASTLAPSLLPTASAPAIATPGATPGASTVPAPRIRSFVVPKFVDCADASFSGFIHVTWTVQYATGASISIDGPGIYQTYAGQVGEADVPFSCGSAPHSYLLTTIGGVGPPAIRQVDVQVSAG